MNKNDDRLARHLLVGNFGPGDEKSHKDVLVRMAEFDASMPHHRRKSIAASRKGEGLWYINTEFAGMVARAHGFDRLKRCIWMETL
jgi:hypothetical protein